jgi:DNA polymerase (family 10)
MEMTQATMDKGYEYLVITDHSKSAFYANGLSEERLMAQLDEIRKINQSINNFRLFSGIESDILSNGSLDYPDEVLSELEVIVASVHSNLKMDIDKATKRLITAIENPYTSILGHPTGRLLLSRKGYPIDHHKVIDACAANNVAIEINANPLRLDIDWTYVQYAVDKGVLISINPDAHSTKGLDDTYYGVCSARKAGLSKYNCLNAYDTEEMEEWIIEQHQKRP